MVGVLVEDRAIFDRHGFVDTPLNEKNGSLLGFVDSGDRRKESLSPARSFKAASMIGLCEFSKGAGFAFGLGQHQSVGRNVA
jgi:hypothetical protein